MRVISVEGMVLRDVLDWLWLASDEEVRLTTQTAPMTLATLLAPTMPTAPTASTTLTTRATPTAPTTPTARATPTTPTTQAAGDSVQEREHVLTRTYGEGWGITFADPLFDGLMTCRNSCEFCFMAMLPKGMRPSLYARDDDYRLSFLQGNFVTLTNLKDEDVRRVIDYHLSPLHVSLHAITPALRRRLMGRNHARGVEVFERLLAAGIEAHAQIVVVPGINDGPELDVTLAWIEQRPNILSTGIVPYGFTKHARIQGGFCPDEARRVLVQLASWQERSRARDGKTRFQLADEWYLLANAPLPPAEHYDGYPQFEDGIGMLRAFRDEWDAACLLSPSPCQDTSATSAFLDERSSARIEPRDILVTGEAFAPTLRQLIAKSFPKDVPVPEVRAIHNHFFGGNVNVAGLLTARDIIAQLTEQGLPGTGAVVLPEVLFNADGWTLDDKRATDIAQALNRRVIVVPCTLRKHSFDMTSFCEAQTPETGTHA
jgi:putative radical SAM enzyme (TIGR03279 family)